MEVQLLSLIEGSKQAKGLTVIIDVFRAFSTACYLAANEPDHLIPVGDKAIAYDLKEKDDGVVLVGERMWKKLPGFDYNNSPFQVKDIDLNGRTVVHTTSSGTQGIVNAKDADEILTGSFVNAKAIVDYIKEKDPEVVSLVAMGIQGVEYSPEDDLCARYIKATLEGDVINFGKIVERLAKEETGKRFLQGGEFHPEDFHLSLSLDRFDFVLRVREYQDGLVELERVPISETVQ